jgi:hypothetical protein
MRMTSVFALGVEGTSLLGQLLKYGGRGLTGQPGGWDCDYVLRKGPSSEASIGV